MSPGKQVRVLSLVMIVLLHIDVLMKIRKIVLRIRSMIMDKTKSSLLNWRVH
jgi:hypothetical protein